MSVQKYIIIHTYIHIYIYLFIIIHTYTLHAYNIPPYPPLPPLISTHGALRLPLRPPPHPPHHHPELPVVGGVVKGPHSSLQEGPAWGWRDQRWGGVWTVQGMAVY